ncbi:hypothetical protein ABT392_14590 [Paucibacter sp. JuS9]|uniref:hypothetical protein n=1 Tax=Paucibacter sp. JuS9 TaxID=3228748 RepID=UPI0037572339
MPTESQASLLSSLRDTDVFRILLADLHDDVGGKVARFHQLTDLSATLGSSGTMLPGGETAFAAWTEARSSFVHGNYVATVLLCQGLAEHVLAAHLALDIFGDEVPPHIKFDKTLKRCVEKGELTQADSDDFKRLMSLRNPLSHYRDINDPTNLSRRTMDSQVPAAVHLLNDATFAISMAIRLLSMPAFKLGD